MSLRNPIQIPGNTLEGGGQLVRISLGLSSLLSLPIHIPRIRAGRPSGGGLKSQHLTCVNWLSKASHSRTVGATKKSRELEFWPPTEDIHREAFWTGKATKRTIAINIGTPGSTTLTVQAILPYLIFATSGAGKEDAENSPGMIELKILGGTNVTHSPSVEYLSQVMFPVLSTHVLPKELQPLRMEVSKRCWVVGSSKAPLGETTFWIPTLPFGSSIPGFEMKDRGEITKICASIIVPGEAINSFKKALADEDVGAKLEIVVEEDSDHPKRYYLLLVAHTSSGYRLGRDVLYDRHSHKTAPESEIAEYMVKRCVKALKKEIGHGGCVDEFMQDELVVFQTLANGRSFVYPGEGMGEGSLHTKTARWVAETLTGIVFDGEGKCEVNGVELKAGSLEWKGKL